MADPEGGDVVSINEQYRWGWGRFKALLSRHHRFTLLGSDVLTAKAICRKVRQAFSVHVSVERVKVRTTGGPANFLNFIARHHRQLVSFPSNLRPTFAALRCCRSVVIIPLRRCSTYRGGGFGHLAACGLTCRGGVVEVALLLLPRDLSLRRPVSGTSCAAPLTYYFRRTSRFEFSLGIYLPDQLRADK